MLLTKHKVALVGNHIFRRRLRNRGLSLLETILAATILTLLVGLVIFDTVGVFRGQRLNRDVSRFVQIMTLTAQQAVFNSNNYLVFIDVNSGIYTVYEEVSKNTYDEFDPLIDASSLDWCYIDEILYDDGSNQYSGELILRATPRGWDRSVLLNLIDDQNEYRRYVRFERHTLNINVSNLPLDFPEAYEELSMDSPI